MKLTFNSKYLTFSTTCSTFKESSCNAFPAATLIVFYSKHLPQKFLHWNSSIRSGYNLYLYFGQFTCEGRTATE